MSHRKQTSLKDLWCAPPKKKMQFDADTFAGECGDQQSPITEFTVSVENLFVNQSCITTLKYTVVILFRAIELRILRYGVTP